MKHPAENAYWIITDVITRGSAKDGCNESWRSKPQMYHLSKAMSHLAVHIKQIYDPRAIDGENHAHLALCRLAMALVCEDMPPMQYPQGSLPEDQVTIRHEIQHSPIDPNRPGGTSPEWTMRNDPNA